MKWKRFSRMTKTVGMSPGSMVHVGQQKMVQTQVSVIEYHTNDFYEVRQTADNAELVRAREGDPVSWINVAGLHDTEQIAEIGEIFGMHPLLLEDILNTEQRPKIDQHDACLYLILKMIQWDEVAQKIETEQISIVLGQGFVLTFQEQEKDIFDSLRQRIRTGKGRIRQRGADYLAYAMLDAVVDYYYVILENTGEQIETIEDELVTDPDSETLQKIHALKREMLFLRRSVWPLREIIGGLQRGDFSQFEQGTLIYLRDVYEHTIQVIDTVETYRDIVSGLLDIYLSSISNKMNEIMKVLTIISTIFIPLTFITGLYGMNFQYIPELQFRWGYFIVWLVMLLLSFAMLLYFKRKKWL